MSGSDVVIAGFSETPVVSKSGRSAYDFGGEAFAALLARTGVAKAEVDGLSVTVPLSEGANPFVAVYMAEALAVTPTWLNASGLGGCSAMAGVARARSAIRDGQCKIAVVVSADAPSTSGRSEYGAYRGEFQAPQGVLSPPIAFGLLMSRYDHQYGLDPRALGTIAVAQRAGAVLNPNALAKFRTPLTLDEYMASRMIADPLRILDCVMFCDGANAFLVMSESDARARGLPFVRPTAYAEVTNFDGQNPLTDVTQTGFGPVAAAVFKQSGLKPADIDQFQPYDDFTIAVMMQLEAFGFCERGQGSAFCLGTDLTYRGSLPVNTGGGQISAGQPGLASGGLNLAEGVRQLLGEAGERQIATPRNALVTGIGTIPYGRNWGTSAAMILEA